MCVLISLGRGAQVKRGLFPGDVHKDESTVEVAVYTQRRIIIVHTCIYSSAFSKITVYMSFPIGADVQKAILTGLFNKAESSDHMQSMSSHIMSAKHGCPLGYYTLRPISAPCTGSSDKTVNILMNGKCNIAYIFMNISCISELFAIACGHA